MIKHFSAEIYLGSFSIEETKNEENIWTEEEEEEEEKEEKEEEDFTCKTRRRNEHCRL